MGESRARGRRAPIEPGGPSDREFHLRRVVAGFRGTISAAGAALLADLLTVEDDEIDPPK